MPIYPHKKKGVPYGFIADLGKNTQGKRDKRWFPERSAAEEFLEKHRKEPMPYGLLLEKKDMFLNCYERLKEVGSNLNEATEYFLKHGAMKPNTTLQQAIEEFATEKKRINRRQIYLDSSPVMYDPFAEYVGREKLIKDITDKEIADYAFDVRGGRPMTRRGTLANLSMLFNFCVRKRYIGFNPAADVQRPAFESPRPEVISPEAFKELLDKCYKNKWFDRLAIYILVGYCGVRPEEASKLCWRDIDLEEKTIRIPAEIAKRHRH